MTSTEGQPQARDVFALHLIGGIIMGGAILLLLESVYLGAIRIPQTEAILRDFGAAAPKLTLLVCSARWLATVFSVCALLAGVGAAFTAHRGLLVVSAALCFLVGAVVWIDRYAIELPMTALVRSVQGQ